MSKKKIFVYGLSIFVIGFFLYFGYTTYTAYTQLKDTIQKIDNVGTEVGTEAKKAITETKKKAIDLGNTIEEKVSELDVNEEKEKVKSGMKDLHSKIKKKLKELDNE